MRVHAHTPVGEIAASLPQTTRLFDVFGIDYVCHGNLSLRDACAEAGVDPADVRRAIDQLPAASGGIAWADVPVRKLLEELRDQRHPRLRSELQRVATVLSEQYSLAPAALREVRSAFTELYEELEPHMRHEERTLFPVIAHLEDCWTRNEHLAMKLMAGIDRPVASLLLEHVGVMAKLRRLVELADALQGHPRLRAEIDGLSHELREHMHLENNVLYPRAVALETAVR